MCATMSIFYCVCVSIDEHLAFNEPLQNVSGYDDMVFSLKGVFLKKFRRGGGCISNRIDFVVFFFFLKGWIPVNL